MSSQKLPVMWCFCLFFILMATASIEQQHHFNAPYQLSVTPFGINALSNAPSEADHHHLQGSPGDLLIVATDGFLDNIYPHEIPSMIEPGATVEDIAQRLLAICLGRSADPDLLSPYAQRAVDSNIFAMGGKRDDTVLVVCRMV